MPLVQTDQCKTDPDMTKLDNTKDDFLNDKDLSARIQVATNVNEPERLPTHQQQYSSGYMSAEMQQLQSILQEDSAQQFAVLGTNQKVIDTDECLMILYCSIVCMNNVAVYSNILARNNNFKVRTECNILFGRGKKDGLFQELQNYPECCAERKALDLVILRASLEKDIDFMTQLVLDTALMTPEMLLTLLQEG